MLSILFCLALTAMLDPVRSSDIVTFDCGSSGTKSGSTKVKPTMSEACTKEGCEDGYDKIKPDSGSKCFAAATAGNRIIDEDVDLNAWTGFRKHMDCSAWMTTKNMKFSQPGSLTIPGTMEAFYEAYLVNKKGGTSFFSAGGASAQYGFKLCNQKVVDEWNKFKNQAEGTILSTQYVAGVDYTIEKFLSSTSQENLDAMDAETVAESGEADISEGDWVLGSFLGGPNSGSVVAGLNEAWNKFRDENTCVMNDEGCKYDKVLEFVTKDPVLQKLATFTETYVEQCDPKKDGVRLAAQMARSLTNLEEDATCSEDAQFHGDWGSMFGNAVLQVLKLKPATEHRTPEKLEWLDILKPEYAAPLEEKTFKASSMERRGTKVGKLMKALQALEKDLAKFH